MMVDQRVEQFSSLEDPRWAGKIEHRLLDILVIAVCVVIGCAESWDDIALNLIAANRTTRTSVRGRRKKAAWNDASMHRLIFG